MLEMETTIYRRCSIVDYKKNRDLLQAVGRIKFVQNVTDPTLSIKLYKLYIPLYQWSCTSCTLYCCTFHSINEIVHVVHCTVEHSTLSMKLYKLYIVPLYIPLYQWSCTSCTFHSINEVVQCTFHSINEVVQVEHSTLSMKLYKLYIPLYQWSCTMYIPLYQ